MSELRVLVPYNFTAHEFKALDFLVHEFGYRKDAKITFFHCFTPLPELNVTNHPLLKMARSGVLFMKEEQKKMEAGLLSAKKHLMANNFSDDQVDCVFKQRERSIAGEIAAAVSKGNYKVLIVAPTPGRIRRFFARSVLERAVRTLKDITVCVVL
jgi:hypothetical protein